MGNTFLMSAICFRIKLWLLPCFCPMAYCYLKCVWWASGIFIWYIHRSWEKCLKKDLQHLSVRYNDILMLGFWIEYAIKDRTGEFHHRIIRLSEIVLFTGWWIHSLGITTPCIENPQYFQVKKQKSVGLHVNKISSQDVLPLLFLTIVCPSVRRLVHNCDSP